MPTENNDRTVFYVTVYEIRGGGYGFRAGVDSAPGAVSTAGEKEKFTVYVVAQNGEETSQTAKRAFTEARREATERGIYVPGISTSE